MKMFLLLSAGWLLVAAGTASVHMKTDVFEKVQFPRCFLHRLKTVFAQNKQQCILTCKSGCKFSMFNDVTGACDLFTDGDTEGCDDTTDVLQYVYKKSKRFTDVDPEGCDDTTDVLQYFYRKASQTYVNVVLNTEGISWFDAQRVCLALGGRLSGYQANTSHDDVITSLGNNACWLGARKLSSGWSWLSGASVTASILEDQNATCLLYFYIPSFPFSLHDHPCEAQISVNQIRCDLY